METHDNCCCKLDKPKVKYIDADKNIITIINNESSVWVHLESNKNIHLSLNINKDSYKTLLNCFVYKNKISEYGIGGVNNKITIMFKSKINHLIIEGEGKHDDQILKITINLNYSQLSDLIYKTAKYL
jgi:hypothetical protein